MKSVCSVSKSRPTDAQYVDKLLCRALSSYCRSRFSPKVKIYNI
jgi:hypothetical protein